MRLFIALSLSFLLLHLQRVSSTATLDLFGPKFPQFPPSSSLLNTQLIFRHGDRTPEQVFPGEENDWAPFCGLDGLAGSRNMMLYSVRYEGKRNTKKGTCNFGVLTKTGMEQLHSVGQSIGKAYGNSTLSAVKSFSSSSILIRSTDFPRTILSAKNLLAGVFDSSPGLNADGFGLPIHIRDLDDEDLFPASTLCPGVSEVVKVLYQNSALNAGVLQLKEDIFSILMNNSSPFFDINIPWIAEEQASSRLFFVTAYYDIVISNIYNRTKVFSVFGKDIINRIVDQADKERRIMFSSHNYTDLLAGQFFQTEVAVNLINTVKSPKTSPSFFFYSAHDVSLMIMMSSITNGFAIEYPGYGAHMLIDLLTLPNQKNPKNKSNYYVRVTYNNGFVTPLPYGSQPLSAGQQYYLVNWKDVCPDALDFYYCPLDTFLSMLERIGQAAEQMCFLPSYLNKRNLEVLWPY